MSALPVQVQQQADEVARIEAELLAAQSPEGDDAEQEGQTAPAAEQSQPDATVRQQEVRQPQSDSEEETWQKRYLTLQGMFNAEVPRLNGRIKELETQLQSAIQQFKEAAQPAKQPEKTEPLVTAKDEEAFGSDLLDLMKRQAQETIRAERTQFQQVIDELKAENAELLRRMGSVSERQGANDRRAYLATLEQTVPGFQQVNVDPQFLAWLDEVDPMTGLARKAYLEDAYAAFDVQRTAAIFNSWPGARNAQPKPSPKAELARQVAPSATRSATAPQGNPQDRVWTMSEIDAFYRDIAKGAYRGREADAQKIEAEIDLAVSQGRLRP